MKGNRGTALIVALTFLAVLMILTSAFVSNVLATTRAQSRLEAQTRSFYIADAGLNYALWQLEKQGANYTGESGFKYGDGYFDIKVSDDPTEVTKRIITSTSWLEGYSGSSTRQSLRAVVKLENREGRPRAILVSWDKAD